MDARSSRTLAWLVLSALGCGAAPVDELPSGAETAALAAPHGKVQDIEKFPEWAIYSRFSAAQADVTADTTKGTCTAFFIDPRVAMVAAHCIVFPLEGDVSRALDTYDFTAKKMVRLWVKNALPFDWVAADDKAPFTTTHHDVALLVLEESAADIKPEKTWVKLAPPSLDVAVATDDVGSMLNKGLQAQPVVSALKRTLASSVTIKVGGITLAKTAAAFCMVSTPATPIEEGDSGGPLELSECDPAKTLPHTVIGLNSKGTALSFDKATTHIDEFARFDDAAIAKWINDTIKDDGAGVGPGIQR